MTEPSYPARARPGFGWGAAGVVTGLTGLAASLATASLLGVRVNPVVGVAEAVIQITPGPLAERLIKLVGQRDKPLLVTGVVVVLLLLFWYAGRLAARRPGASQIVFLVLAALGGLAVLTRPNALPTDLVPVLVGGVVWLALMPWLTARLRSAAPVDDASRRAFLLRLGGGVLAAGVLGGLSRFFGRGRRAVEATRKLLRLPITMPPVPAGADLGIDGQPPWRTPASSFYLIHTAIGLPAVDPTTWRLRVHGMVEKELSLSFQDLVDRQLTEAWITLNCVSNPVGGDLVGNAWWSGVRIADVLAEAGVLPGADAVKQTSEDGWNCGTPLGALTDDRNAMLALGMNGQPLPIEHGFPVRMIVPGLYGYVSATKWLVDLEVTRFQDFSAYWTDRGWSERGPVKIASRIDVPRSGQRVPAGVLTVAGTAWQQHSGVRGVELSVDGGPWSPATLGTVPDTDTWVQWRGEVRVSAGDHQLQVRAIDAAGQPQTSVVRDVVPDGATGLAGISFTAT